MSAESRDSTAVLQAAIDAAAGSSLVLRSGTYLVTGLRLPRQGIRLMGPEATLLLSSEAADGSSVIVIPKGAENIVISGLTIDGNAVAIQGRRINGIASEGHSKRVAVCANHIFDISRNGIILNNGDSEWDISRNRISRSGRFGIVVDFLTTPVMKLRVTDNEISESAEGPISFVANRGGHNDAPSAGVWDAYLAYNKVRSNGQGISGYSPNNRDIVVLKNEIVGSGIRNVKGHAAHWAGTNIKILANKMTDTALSAVMISSWPNGNPEPIKGYEIRDNVIDGVTSLPGGTGILIRNASRGEIAFNIIRRVMESGIYVTGAALGARHSDIKTITIHDNRVEMDGSCAKGANFKQYGIAVLHAKGAEIANNSVKGSCRAGIFTQNLRDETIIGNDVSGSVVGPGLEAVGPECLSRKAIESIRARNSLEGNARGAILSAPDCR